CPVQGGCAIRIAPVHVRVLAHKRGNRTAISCARGGDEPPIRISRDSDGEQCHTRKNSSRTSGDGSHLRYTPVSRLRCPVLSPSRSTFTPILSRMARWRFVIGVPSVKRT